MTRSFTGVMASTCSECPATAVPPSPEAWRAERAGGDAAGYRAAASEGAGPHLAVEAVQRHRGVRQADHPHAGGGDVRERRLVPAPPLRLPALRLAAAAALGAAARRAEARGREEPAPQEALGLGARRPGGGEPQRADAARQDHGARRPQQEQHGARLSHLQYAGRTRRGCYLR